MLRRCWSGAWLRPSWLQCFPAISSGEHCWDSDWVWIVVGATTLTLLFGGAGVANASAFDAPVTATTTTVAQEAEQEDGDNTGLWGLAGLLGLIGLAGLKRRKDADHSADRGGAIVTSPRP